VEVTTEPVMACKIRVCLAGIGGFSHCVMKKCDLQKLHEAFIQDFPETTHLLKLPPNQPSQQAESSAFPFSVWIVSYLGCLVCNRDALETHSFQNFFQLSDAHNDRISALRLLRANRACSATKTAPARKPGIAQASVLVGEASAFCPPQTEPSLDHTVRFTSCSCSSSKVCTRGFVEGRGKQSLFS